MAVVLWRHIAEFRLFEDCPRALMVVRDFDIVCITVLPAETYPILLIYPNAQLSLSIPFQSFEPIAWRNPQVL